MKLSIFIILLGTVNALLLAPFQQTGTYTLLPDIGNQKILHIDMVNGFRMYFYNSTYDVVCDLHLIVTGTELSIKVSLDDKYENALTTIGNETKKQFDIYWNPLKFEITYHDKVLYTRIDPHNKTLSTIRHTAFEPQYESSITFDDTYIYIANKYDLCYRTIGNIQHYENLVPYLQCNLSIVDSVLVNGTTIMNLDLRKVGFKDEVYRFLIGVNSTSPDYDFPDKPYAYFKILKNNQTQLKGTAYYFTDSNITIGVNFDEGVLHVNNEKHLSVLWNEQSQSHRYKDMKYIILHAVRYPNVTHSCELLCFEKTPEEKHEADHWYQRWFQNSKSFLHDNTPFIFKSKKNLDSYCKATVKPIVKTEYVSPFCAVL